MSFELSTPSPEQAESKDEKINRLYKAAKVEFEKLDIHPWEKADLFDKIYSDYNDDDEIEMRDQEGKLSYAYTDEKGQDHTSQKKSKFDNKDKERQVSGILGMIDLDFKSLSFPAINNLKRNEAILNLAESKGNDLKLIVKEISSL